MLQKTRGIVLKVTNYSESSVVAQIFTEELGLQPYIINGARKPKAKIRTNMLQPLHLLDMVVYLKEGDGLQRIKEAQASPTLYHIPIDIVKSSVAMFLNEVIFKVLKHAETDRQLFQFIYQSILWMDATQAPIYNFHLCFLMKLSRFLGYLPTIPAEPQPYFDLVEGIFTKNLPSHSYILQAPHTALFHAILSSTYEDSPQFHMKQEERKYLLTQIINFYKLHTENFGVIHSLQILEEIFH